MVAQKNRRVLIIDDNRSIHDDFHKILSPGTATAEAWHAAEAALFGASTEIGRQAQFDLDSAYQGEEGLRMVKQAIEIRRPYALAFVDVRMPPGWDGVETTRRLWEVDPELQVVICTAYSDYSWGEMMGKLGQRDGLLILKKPFDAVEALQLAHAMTEKWWLHRQSQRKVEELEQRVQGRTLELQQANTALQKEVADHRLAEGLMRESNEKFNQLADHITDAFWIRSPDLNELHYISPAFERIWGRSVASLYANPQDWPNFIYAEDRERVMDAFAALKNDAPSLDIEYRIVRPDGEIRWVRVRGFQVLDGTGKPIRHTGIVTDITERKQVENVLRESEERFSGAFEYAPIGVALVAPDGRWLKVNQAICALVGYSESELLARSFQEITCPEDLERDLENVRQVIAGEIRSYQMEKRYIHKRGHLIPVLLSVSLVRDDQGQPRYFISQIQDITERKQAEFAAEAVSKLGHRLSSASSAHEGFNIIKEVSKELFAWDAFCIRSYSAKSDSIYSGYTIDTINGEQIAEERTEPAPPGPLYRRIIEQGGELIQRDDLTTPLPGLTPFGDVSRLSAVLLFVPIRSHGEVAGILSVQSYTPNAYNKKHLRILQTMADQCGGAFERIWADEALRKSEAQLFQSQKLETVGKLAGGIAHEFNSILTAIIGQSELMLTDLPAGDPLTRNAQGIRRAAERAAKLTRQLLAYGRKSFLRPETLDLNQVIVGLEGMFQQVLGGGVDLRIIATKGLHAVKADAGQIEQVIMNLVINASDAMPNGGKLTLETANISLDPATIGSDAELKPGDYVLLAISDTGIGMSKVTKARVFEPFFTTKDVGQGTGLGLSTCYGIVKQSGGHITVYSEPGMGTTFKIYLPQFESRSSPAGPQLDVPDLPRGTETILLVEDDPALREMAASLLQRLGYTVLAAANGIDALSLKAQSDVGPIDLLFTDVVMPHMSGRELAERVRVSAPRTRILFTSAYTEQAIAHRGVLDPGAALLQKPFTPAALARKLRDLLDAPIPPKPLVPANAASPGKSAIR